MRNASDHRDKAVEIDFDILFNALPYVFYKDKSGVYLGGNVNQAKTFGFESPSEFIGKTIYQILSDQKSAKKIDGIDREIMNGGSRLAIEEVIVLPEGNRTFLSQKQAIFGVDGEVIGMLGFAMDITELKEQQRIIEFELEQTKQRAQQAELAHYKQLAEQQRQFQKTARQVAHDIRSPLSALLMMLKFCLDIPEQQRVMLRNAAARIEEIANNLFASFPKAEAQPQIEQEKRRAILVSSALLEILAEKKIQLSSNNIKISHRFSTVGSFAWINIQPSAFKRMISNLVNNSVEALNESSGIVDIELDADLARVQIIIEDNGKGMSADLVQKIRSQISVSEGKPEGHGIGLMQVRDTLDANDGQWSIESEINIGTRITAVFPRVPAEPWIADVLHIFDNDTIIVLDDDHSIHHAWDMRFKELQSEYSTLKIVHHQRGNETINFFDNLNEDGRSRAYLLSDYELLNQELNGLQIIEKVASTRSALVTSHYSNSEVQQEALRVGTKILPKPLAAEVRVYVARGS